MLHSNKAACCYLAYYFVLKCCHCNYMCSKDSLKNEHECFACRVNLFYFISSEPKDVVRKLFVSWGPNTLKRLLHFSKSRQCTNKKVEHYTNPKQTAKESFIHSNKANFGQSPFISLKLPSHRFHRAKSNIFRAQLFLWKG